MTTRRSTIAALLLVACALPAASLPAAAQAPQRGGTLTFAIASEPPNYDCHSGNTFGVLHALSPHYSTLLRFDLANYPRVVGDLAAAWDVSADGLTYRFRLHDNLRFHDGSPLTSRDVKATYERLRNPPPGIVSVRMANFEDIDRIDTPDPLSLVFVLKRANAAMPATFASPWNCVYSAAKLEADPKFPERTVLGTGAFTFVEHVQGSHWVGRRYEAYHRAGLPYLDGFRASFLPAPQAFMNALQGGQIQADFRGVAPAQKATLVDALGARIEVLESSALNHLIVAFNTEKAPFDDARVRRALNLAIDRWGGSAGLSRVSTLRAVGGLMRPGSPYAIPEEDLAKLPGFGRDIAAARAEARRLLAEAGQSNLRFTFTNRTLANPYTPPGVFLIDQWRQIGVTVEHRQLETGPWTQALASGTFDVIMDFSNEFVDEPSFSLSKYISFDRAPINASRLIDRSLDDLFDRQKAATDPALRLSLVRQFEARLFEQSYAVPLLWFHRAVPLRSEVKGWNMSPSNTLGQDLTEVWLQQ